MRTKTYKKGEQTNKLQVLRDLLYDNTEVEPLFEEVPHPDEIGRFFGGKTQVAAKDFKVTLIVEEL